VTAIAAFLSRRSAGRAPNQTFCDGGHSGADGRLSHFRDRLRGNPPEEQTMNIVTKGSESRFISSQADELAAVELEHVWGGKPKAAPQSPPLPYLTIKMQDAQISSYSL
jgi:hypothetical protein